MAIRAKDLLMDCKLEELRGGVVKTRFSKEKKTTPGFHGLKKCLSIFFDPPPPSSSSSKIISTYF